MITIRITQGEGPAYIDRATGYFDRDGKQVVGFEIAIGGVELRFDDEADALSLANKILQRLGYSSCAQG